MEGPPTEVPEIPPGVEIRPEAVETGDQIGRPRFRGTGRLLSTTQGVGLAVLRLEQVEAVEQGRARFILSAGEGQPLWQATPYRPDWWPNPPPQET